MELCEIVRVYTSAESNLLAGVSFGVSQLNGDKMWTIFICLSLNTTTNFHIEQQTFEFES